MPSLKKLVVLFAILILPSRLPAQVYQPVPQPANLQPAEVQPAPVAAVPADVPTEEAAVPVEDCQHSWSPWALFSFTRGPCGKPHFESIFIFGGQFTKGSMGDTVDIFNVTYDNKYIIGLGYQRFPWSSRYFYWGWEVGTASRFGGDYSHEFWAGAVLRHHGFTIADTITITPALTAGFSIVTDTMGHEARRVEGRDGDGTFLYYLGPEIILSTPSNPRVEVFYRLHHRCGGGRTLGRLSEGYNANTIGVRWKF